MTAFYNEPDPYAAQWLENLIAAGHIAPGIVDRRPIQQIEAWELAEFTQCHFFAGIGIWSYALRRAGWPDDRPIWTGSCPCQPFSNAGQRKGISDERHLWPYWHQLIDQRHPPIIVGEQVASKDGLGWLDLVSTDLEASDYAFAAADLCAAGFQQAHIRQRLYFVGLADDAGERCHRGENPTESGRWNGSENGGAVERLAHHHHPRLEGWREPRSESSNQLAPGSNGLAVGLADPLPAGRAERGSSAGNRPSAGSGADGRMEHSDLSSQHRRASSREQPLCNFGDGTDQKSDSGNSGQIASRWFDVDWLLCRNPNGEPSWRPVEAGTFPLAHGITSRMGKLRAFGNGLDEETATNFCEVVREIVDDLRPLEREYDL